MSNKNRYGNVAGVHNPLTAEKHMKELNEILPIEVQDSSWHNDVSDSVANYKHRIQIFFPNPSEEGAECFYCIRTDDDLPVPTTGNEAAVNDDMGNEYNTIKEVKEWVEKVIVTNSEMAGKIREMELEEELMGALIGWTIHGTRFMNKEEMEDWGWCERGIILTLSRKVLRSLDNNDYYIEQKQVVVQQDPEGNGPGALLIIEQNDEKLFGAIR